jgi:hypothetical protein
MKSILLALFLAVCSLLIPSVASAWSGPGHLVIAAEAYRELSPELKAEVFDVLKAHPDFAKWEKAYHPNPNLDLAAYVFMKSSAWPDEIRRSGSQYDHPNWHFIDYPLVPPTFPIEPGPKPMDDVLFGVAQCEKTLSDTNASPELRAVYLSWLIHLVGDIHQPLHCASLFTDTYLKCGGPVPPLPKNTNNVVQRVLPEKIGTSEASRYYDEEMVVTGKVVQVTVRPNVAILNLDQASPDSPFTAVIFQENVSQFGDLQKLKNQLVEINGTITEYRGKPEIILESPNQIKVVGSK